MKKVTKSRINAIENAATWLITMDIFSGLTQAECDDHKKLGEIMRANPKKVTRFLIELNKQ